MGFVCGNPSMLFQKMEMILCNDNRLVHSSQNSVLVKTSDRGFRILYKKGWVAGMLRKFNMNEGFVNYKLLDMVAKSEEGNIFCSSSEGIQLKRMLDPTADETEVVQEVTKVMTGGRSKVMRINEIFSKLPKSIQSGRFFGKLANLQNFFDFHEKQFYYCGSDNVGILDEFLEKAKAIEKIHLVMREYGIGQSREMTLKALFKVWKVEKGTLELEVQNEHELEQILKEHGAAKFWFKESGVIALVVPSVGDGGAKKKNAANSKSGNVKMQEVQLEIKEALQKAKDGSSNLNRVLESLSDKSKTLVPGMDELKTFLNLQGDTFRFINSSMIALSGGEFSKTNQPFSGKKDRGAGDNEAKFVKDAAVSMMLETVVKAYGCDNNISLKSAWTHLKDSRDATILQDFNSTQDLVQFLNKHGGKFSFDGHRISLVNAKMMVVVTNKKDSAATPKRGLNGSDVKLIKELMGSGKHSPVNSALAYFDFKNKTCKDKKVYFKISWVWERMGSKLSTSSVQSSASLLGVLMKHHLDEFIIFKNKDDVNASLLHSRDIFSKLPTEQWAVEKVREAIKKQGGVCDTEELWQKLPTKCKARIQGKTCFGHFFDFHKKEFQCNLK